VLDRNKHSNDRDKMAQNSEHNAKQLKTRLTSSMIAVFLLIFASLAATYAWYIYNTSRHTTNVKMAAGTGVNLQISNTYDGDYSSATVLAKFPGQLVPVSTNRISGGFQKVTLFKNGGEGQAPLVTDTFTGGQTSDYYHTKLFLRTTGATTDIYLSDIGYEDSDEENPISSAIRVGLVVHQPGENQQPEAEYIFAISDKKNPQAQYNTDDGEEGHVLDRTRTDGTTVPFTPYTSDAYCNYNKSTGEVTLKQNSQKICTVSGDGEGKAGRSVEVEVYIWLEGCDEDCTSNLSGTTLQNLALSFAGIVR
jgi:hypothetical protein